MEVLRKHDNIRERVISGTFQTGVKIAAWSIAEYVISLAVETVVLLKMSTQPFNQGVTGSRPARPTHSLFVS